MEGAFYVERLASIQETRARTMGTYTYVWMWTSMFVYLTRSSSVRMGASLWREVKYPPSSSIAAGVRREFVFRREESYFLRGHYCLSGMIVAPPPPPLRSYET